MVDYGDWPSDWSAERAVAAGRDFSELKAAHGGLAWVEFDPASARSRLYLWRDGVLEEPTAPDGSVRSRVYEYGGGACCVTLDGLAWVDETDQQVRRWRAGRAAQVLGGGVQYRYGDLAYVDAWDALLAVEESHGSTGVVHRIVRLDADGTRRVLVEGADFYAAPRAAGQGRRLAWIEWDRPHQPWTETRLGLAENGHARCLAGAGGGESIQQPRFDPAGRLHWLSDRDGWWRPCAEVALAGRFADADHAGAPWQLGACSYLPLGREGCCSVASRPAAGNCSCAKRTAASGAWPRTGTGSPDWPRMPGRSTASRRRPDACRRCWRSIATSCVSRCCVAASDRWRRTTCRIRRPSSMGWATAKTATVSSIRRAMPAAASIPDDHRRCWCGCMADRPRCIRRRSMPACSSGPSAVSPWRR